MKRPILLCVAFAWACSSSSSGGGGTSAAGDPALSTGENGAESTLIEGNTESLSTLFVSGSGALAAQSFSGSDLSPKDANGDVATFFRPTGCVTSTADTASHSVTHVFTNCTGPFGLLHLNGTVKVEHATPSASELDLTLSASNFAVNKATLTSWQATAKITADASGGRAMTWDGNLQGTSGRGLQFSRKNHKQIQWTAKSGCVSVNGTSDGLFAAASLHTEVKTFSWCTGGCPDASSEITVTDVDDGKSFDLKFGGGPSATFTGPDGTAKQLALACGS
jgi:hypothetical protein